MPKPWNEVYQTSEKLHGGLVNKYFSFRKTDFRSAKARKEARVWRWLYLSICGRYPYQEYLRRRLDLA